MRNWAPGVGSVHAVLSTSLELTRVAVAQLLERVDAIHSRHLLHRDIKPANFVMGDGHSSPTVFGIDYGHSKRYRNPHTLQHIPHRLRKSLCCGTPRYASINNHLGIEQSRRDDLEARPFVVQCSAAWACVVSAPLVCIRPPHAHTQL